MIAINCQANKVVVAAAIGYRIGVLGSDVISHLRYVNGDSGQSGWWNKVGAGGHISYHPLSAQILDSITLVLNVDIRFDGCVFDKSA